MTIHTDGARTVSNAPAPDRELEARRTALARLVIACADGGADLHLAPSEVRLLADMRSVKDAAAEPRRRP